MHDGCDLPGIEAPAGVQLQHYRGGGLARIAQEDRGLRQRQMHPCTLHALHLDDGARQLRLQHRLIAGALHHGAAAERGFLLNHLDSHRIALRQPLARQANAGFLHFGFRHRHRARWIEFEFDARLPSAHPSPGRSRARRVGRTAPCSSGPATTCTSQIAAATAAATPASKPTCLTPGISARPRAGVGTMSAMD